MDENLALQLQHLRPAELLELTSFVALLRRGDLKQAQQLLNPLLSPSSRDAFGQFINHNAEKTRCLYALKAVIDHCAARQLLTEGDHLLFSSNTYAKAIQQYNIVDRNALDEGAKQQLQFNITLASMHLNQQFVVDIEELLRLALTVEDTLLSVNFVALMLHLEEYKQARVLLQQLKDVQHVPLLDLCRAISFVQQQRFLEAETALTRVRAAFDESDHSEEGELLVRAVEKLQSYINKCRVQFVVNVGQQHNNINSPLKNGTTSSPSSFMLQQHQQRPTTAQGATRIPLLVKSPTTATTDYATANATQSVNGLSIDATQHSEAFSAPPSSSFMMMKRHSIGGSVGRHKMEQGPIHEALQRGGVYDRISPAKPSVYTSPSLPSDWLRASTSPDHAMTVSGPLAKDAISEAGLQSSVKPLRKSVNRSPNKGSEARTMSSIQQAKVSALSVPSTADIVVEAVEATGEVSPLTVASTTHPDVTKQSEASDSIMARLVTRNYVVKHEEEKKDDGDTSPRPSIRIEKSQSANVNHATLSFKEAPQSAAIGFRKLYNQLSRNTSPRIDRSKQATTQATNPAASVKLKPVDAKSPVMEKEADESRCLGPNWRSMLRSLSPSRLRSPHKQSPQAKKQQVISPITIKSVNSHGHGLAKVVSPEPAQIVQSNDKPPALSPQKAGPLPLTMLLAPGPYPPGIDVTRREEYLSPEEFVRAFDMTQLSFSQLPRWKQIELKKKTGLF